MLAIGATLPLVAMRFPATEAALWYLFLTIASLQLVADLSMSSVFGRLVAYAAGGAQNLGDQGETGAIVADSSPNAALLHAIHATAHPVYVCIAGGWVIFAGAFGAWAAADLVRAADDPAAAATAGAVVIFATAARLYGNRYTAVLFGLSDFVAWRRFEAIAWLVSAAVGATFVLAGAGLLGLTLVFFGLIAANSVAYRVLAGGALRRVAGTEGGGTVDVGVLREVLPRAWRGGIGVLLHVGTMHALTASVARLEPAATAASYLLAYNVARAIDQVAQAPFYTKLPALARLRAQRDAGFRALASSGMRTSYWVLAIGLAGAALLAVPVLQLIRSQTLFVDSGIWAALATSMFFERYGATHLQTFMTTNQVVVHVANGIAGILTLALAYVLYGSLGLLGIPLAGLFANGLWYAPYGAVKSRVVLGGQVFAFELATSVGPAALLAVAVLVSLLD